MPPLGTATSEISRLRRCREDRQNRCRQGLFRWMRRLVVEGLLVTQCLAVAAAEPEWTHWGGPHGDFTVESAPLADSWPEGGPPRLWQRPLGAGYSSILHRDGRLYTAYRDGDEQVVIALEAASGETLWASRSRPQLWPEVDTSWGKGPNATPLLIGERLLMVDIAGTIEALDDASGKRLWSRSLPDDFGRISRLEEYGYSASPLPYRDTALVVTGGDRHAVVALDPRNGSLVWGSEPGATSYGPPTLLHLAGRDQFLYLEPQGVVSLDPATGETLWRSPIGGYPSDHNGNHLTPVVKCDERHVWIGSQWRTGGGRLLEISGSDGDLEATVRWYDPKKQTAQWTMVREGEIIYGSLGSNRTSLLSAFSWQTGELLWSHRGFHKAQALYVDGKLLFIDEAGDLVLARVSPQGLEVLANAAVLDSKAWTLPTLVGETLYLRDEQSILALDLRKHGPPQE